jgi:hypothetical protein
VTGKPSKLMSLTNENGVFGHKMIVHGVECYSWLFMEEKC